MTDLDAGWESEVLAEIKEELSQYRCCHGENHMEDTPPMFYPEAIRCIVKRAKNDGALLERQRRMISELTPRPLRNDMNNNFRVTVSTTELLAKLRENRDRHGKMYREAVEGFLKDAKEQLESKLQLISRGVIKDLSILLSPPIDCTSEYETAIQMVEMHQESTIELSSHEFRCFIQDEWDWVGNWLTSNSRWSSTASSYSFSKKHLLRD